jgi:hypothetical protein
LDPVTLVFQTPPKDEYEKAVLMLYENMQVPDVLQQICGRWFPAHGRDVADSFLAWRAEHEDLLNEIRHRMHAIWIDHGGGDERVVRVVDYYDRKDRYASYMRAFDEAKAADFEMKCIDYPRRTKSPDWNMSQRFARELELIRQRPRPAPVDTSATSPGKG